MQNPIREGCTEKNRDMYKYFLYLLYGILNFIPFAIGVVY